MSKNPLGQLTDFGQSFWYDNIQRKMLKNGDLEKMIQQDGLRGITSNPSIFEKAITGSSDYDQSLLDYAKTQNPTVDTRAAFFELAIQDIQAAADMLLPVYQTTNGVDGYVSLEVSPDLAHDTAASVKEAQQLYLRLKRPNVMIKIPATKAGIPAIEQLIADGISVNATLLFSVERYVEVAKAYIRGLTTRHTRGLPIDNISSVASFFVSRVDAILDAALDDKGAAGMHLKGKMGIANAKVAYREYLALVESDEFKQLATAGAKPQRLLWASTGVKNPEYSDVLYIDGLIGKNTVNTIPPATADAFRDHGTASETLSSGIETAEKEFTELHDLGIDVSALMNKLEADGVASFAKSFDNLLTAIDDKLHNLDSSVQGAA